MPKLHNKPPSYFRHKSSGQAVVSIIRDASLPVEQVVIFSLKAGESLALQSVLLNVGNTPLDLALVTGRLGLGGQDADATHTSKHFSTGC